MHSFQAKKLYMPSMNLLQTPGAHHCMNALVRDVALSMHALHTYYIDGHLSVFTAKRLS